MIEVDARGLSCPEPVIRTMDAMKENAGQEIRVLVSSSVARDNVVTLAKKNKREASWSEDGEDFVVEIR